MVQTHSRLFLGVSRRRASLFTLVAGAMFIAGFLLSEFAEGRETGSVFNMGVLLLFVTLILTTTQAYLNGSAVLALLFSVSLPLGFMIEPILFDWHSGLLSMIHLGLTVGLLFGVTGHLIGSQLTALRETRSEPSFRGQIALAGLMFGAIGWYLL